MKRLLNLQRYSRTVQCLHVVGGFHGNHRSVTHVPDLDFDAIAGRFPEHMVHQKVDPCLPSRFGLSDSQLTLGLLPVTTSTAGSEATFWVPFLVHIGSPATLFSKKTIDALKMDLADHIDVEGKRILWREATGRFTDVNVLGTDFLQHGDLSVCYRTGEVQFSLVDTSPMTSVTVFGLGTSLTVTPATLTAQGLKFAIKAMLPNSLTCDAPDLIIETPEGHVLGSCDPIRADVKYSFSHPPTRNAWDRSRAFCGF
jgi:hypothetical protein